MAKIKEKDFVELEYTGKITDGDEIFDTTDEEVAKENGLFNPQHSYGPIIVCVGRQHVIPGIDTRLKGKEAGKEYAFEIPAEEGFGKKSSKLLKLMGAAAFKKQDVNPQPGLQVQVDGRMGTIRSVTSGRVVVDFNHPLAGKDLAYAVKVNKVVTAKADKVKALTKMLLGAEPLSVTVKENKATVKLTTDIPEQFATELGKEYKELIGVEPKFVADTKTDDTKI